MFIARVLNGFDVHFFFRGFGLHAGKAVQGAIGSQRKLDATYLSLAVERAEFLESNTKTYGVPLLMSDSFYNLLDSVNKYRCRKIDQLILLSGENDCLTDPREILDSGEKMSIVSEICCAISSLLTEIRDAECLLSSLISYSTLLTWTLMPFGEFLSQMKTMAIHRRQIAILTLAGHQSCVL